jgi:hypothetical protein
MDEQEDSQKFRGHIVELRGHIVELIEDHESKLEDNPTRIQFIDANLMHDIATGRSVTGMLHL